MSNDTSKLVDLARRHSGELFWLLQDKLVGGELSMRTETLDGDVMPTMIVYRWTFVNGDKKFGVEECVDFKAIKSSRWVEVFAACVAAAWNGYLESATCDESK